MLEMARSEPGIPILPKEMDRDPWLLNCANGTLELRTGQLREHRREDLVAVAQDVKGVSALDRGAGQRRDVLREPRISSRDATRSDSNPGSRWRVHR